MFKTTESLGFLVVLWVLCGLSNAVQAGIHFCNDEFSWFLVSGLFMFFSGDLLYKSLIKMKLVYNLEIYEVVWGSSNSEIVQFLVRARECWMAGDIAGAQEALRRFEQAKNEALGRS